MANYVIALESHFSSEFLKDSRRFIIINQLFCVMFVVFVTESSLSTFRC